MKHVYLYIFTFTAVLTGAMLGFSSKALANTEYLAPDTTKTSVQQNPNDVGMVDTRNNRPQDMQLTFKPFTPFALTYKNDAESSKIISGVKVFPNPVSE